MQPVLLIDIGSTYTKITAVDLIEPRVLGTAAAHTTVTTDVAHGLNQALADLALQIGALEYDYRLACSSAAGGLRMVACGLTPSLTEKAARMACLGAGAKVIRSFSYKLTEEDVAEIAALAPDILLLAGGTDGGNEEVITHNASMLASCEADFPIVLAGNRNAAAACKKLLDGRAVYQTENVMPRLDELNAKPVQEQVRALFLERIIHAKGLGPVADWMTAPLLPTPAAVLVALELLASGTDDTPGIGELVAVDLGGATTDVYSMAHGDPTMADTVLRGIPEPFAKRTVEGDIGMRYSVHGVVEAVGIDRIARGSGLPRERVEELVTHLSTHPDTLPDTPELAALDRTLASAAVMTAVARHAGSLETVYTSQGPTLVQTGKDLCNVAHLIVTGGAIIHSPWSEDVAKSALFDTKSPNSLRPKEADTYIDQRYVLASMGLLSQVFPEAALTLMKKEIRKHGTEK